MKTDERLLQFFAKHEGEYLSGETLAQTLNISRAAVWKVIQKLIDQSIVSIVNTVLVIDTS